MRCSARSPGRSAAWSNSPAGCSGFSAPRRWWPAASSSSGRSWRCPTSCPGLGAGGNLFARVAGALKGRVPGHPFATGLFLGLLPCGLLYSALIAAAARGGALEGAAALAAVRHRHGAGPARRLRRRRTAGAQPVVLNRLSQVFLLAMGLWFLWTGFALS